MDTAHQLLKLMSKSGRVDRFRTPIGVEGVAGELVQRAPRSAMALLTLDMSVQHDWDRQWLSVTVTGQDIRVPKMV